MKMKKKKIKKKKTQTRYNEASRLILNCHLEHKLNVSSLLTNECHFVVKEDLFDGDSGGAGLGDFS